MGAILARKIGSSHVDQDDADDELDTEIQSFVEKQDLGRRRELSARLDHVQNDRICCAGWISGPKLMIFALFSLFLVGSGFVLNSCSPLWKSQQKMEMKRAERMIASMVYSIEKSIAERQETVKANNTENMETKHTEQLIAGMISLNNMTLWEKLQETVKVNNTEAAFQNMETKHEEQLNNVSAKLQETVQGYIQLPEQVPGKVAGTRNNPQKKVAGKVAMPPKQSIEKHALQRIFEDIASENAWQSKESISGTGSEMNATRYVRKCLSDWITKYSVKVLLDIPCGDGNWQGAIPGMENIEYRGFDISQTAVQRARIKNAQKPSMHFDVFDITRAVPMKADLLIMRDFIQHLPLDLGRRAFKNAKRAGIKWLAVSTYAGTMNKIVGPGQMYWANVQASPFFLGSEVEDCPNYSPGTHAPAVQIRKSRFRVFDLQNWDETSNLSTVSAIGEADPTFPSPGWRTADQGSQRRRAPRVRSNPRNSRVRATWNSRNPGSSRIPNSRYPGNSRIPNSGSRPGPLQEPFRR